MLIRLNKIFGESIDIDSKSFEKEVNLILQEATTVSGVFPVYTLPLVNSRMDSYKNMLEKGFLDTELLETLLKEIIVLSLLNVTCDNPYEYLRDTLIKKNSDYGNSSIKNGGNVGNYVRMSDKVSRLGNLYMKKDLNNESPNYESIEDTWLDLAGYATIGIIISRLTANLTNSEKNEIKDDYAPFGFDFDND